MVTKKFRYFSADFETTVYKGQTYTEAWAAACVELFTEDVSIFHSLPDLFDYLVSLKQHICIYFHNLKFDGSFWLDFLINKKKYKQAYEILDGEKYDNGQPKHVKFLAEKDMQNKSFKYSISDRGQWYSVIIKVNGHYIEIRDSLKLLPFSVKRIGESFGTKHKKLTMEYKGFRYAGCEITDKEKEYIANDVLVVKEALEIMFTEGHDKLTIGSCCLSEFKKTYGLFKEDYTRDFPNLYDLEIDNELYGYASAGEFILKSYRGAWCYLAKGKEGKIYENGITLDVNSLYPSMMHSESGNYYPVGNPHFWVGNLIPDQALICNRYYFVRLKTRFYIKEGYLPFIQIKNNPLYDGTEMLESSDITDYSTGLKHSRYIDAHGNERDTRIEFVMTMTDYKLFLEHYNVVDFEILGGCWFYSEIGLFDNYINKYKQIKMTSKGARRELAKLFLNNLYGKLASSTNSSFKIAYVKDNGVLGFTPVFEQDKEPGYIPCGSAITSYARNFTIRAAQKNYHGKYKPGFIYADTDSIHCDLNISDVKGVDIDDANFCCWKHESSWDRAIFTRQKTYIEHIQQGNSGYYNIKCAGMPDRCKYLFDLSMSAEIPEDEEFEPEELEFLKTKRTLSDFNVGLKVPGKLLPHRIPGGIVLKETYYEMR